MSDSFERSRLLLGQKALNILKNSRVAVFGVGGVGGFAVEALVRTGVGAIDLIDNDTVSESNLNRQIIASINTVGRAKVDVAAERILSINPDCRVTTHKMFFLPENADTIDFTEFDYVIDAIDTISGKLALAKKATEAKTPIISSMGAGNKLDPTAFEVADIYSTSVCPLARVMRRELKARGIKRLKVVYSKEQPLKPLAEISDDGKRQIPGSVSFVPSVAGLIIGGEVIKDLTGGRA